MIPLIWLVAGVVLILAEVLSGALVLLMLGVAALVAAAATAGLGVVGGGVTFAVVAGLGVLVARPALSHRLRTTPPVNTGTRGLLGTAGEVVEPITPDHLGTVRLDGALWSARALHDDTLEAGARVVVVQISGATAVVTAP